VSALTASADKEIKEKHPDMIFLDIQMPKLTVLSSWRFSMKSLR
jgi:CheY-like chemotaxis protein